MKRITYEVQFRLQGPVLTQATAAGEFGIDAPAARTADGKLCIPGTLVKGRMRQACEELNGLIPDNEQQFPVDTWFGKISGNRDNNLETVAPQRGAIYFGDFVADEPKKKGSATIHRVRMDEYTGTVDKGAYLVMEAPVPPGQEIAFTGNITLVTAENPLKLGNKLLKALRWITSLGGERTVGFGSVKGVDLKLSEQYAERNRQPLVFKADSCCLALTLSPEGPFCLAMKKADGNLFASEEIIPGNVIKGGIATTWGLMLGKGANPVIDDQFDLSRPELCRNFSRLRISHAFPAEKGKQRPAVAPLSLVKVKTEEKEDEDLDKDLLYDVAALSGICLIHKQAPAFAIDWKSSDDVRKEFGWPKLKRQMLVRTAMSREHLSAEKEQLFAYESIVPDGVCWHGTIDLAAVPENERQKVAEQFSAILANGLVGWSKTKTTAAADITVTDAPVATDCFPYDGTCIITLQTPAILCNPENLNEQSGCRELLETYQQAIADISGNSLKLVRFFARQELLGGYYQHQRFQKGKPYHPWIMTTTGSVFVLQPEAGMEQNAQETLQAWQFSGLPLPQWAKDMYARNDSDGNHWQNCPYLPENGYGEIALNLACHKKLKPEGNEYEEVADVR